MGEEKLIGKHSLRLDRRGNAFITGILEVISFDEASIIIDTDLGVLVLNGIDLHVNRLNLDMGEVDVEGYITSISYEESAGGKAKNSFFGKILK